MEQAFAASPLDSSLGGARIRTLALAISDAVWTRTAPFRKLGVDVNGLTDMAHTRPSGNVRSAV
jgi:hypothetical protein